MIGTMVQQYRVEKKLGKGGMASVYLATDTILNRPAALKFILSDFDDHPDMTKRFLEEARVLASLNRVNIPVLYGYFIWEGKGVMAMEYVNGPTLDDLVLQRGPIPAEICVPWIKQALQGLAAAHRIGIVHRDLKPSNLMLNHEETIKVVDFGIAKKIEVEAGLTATNTTVGTPFYMAPEQILGKPVTPRTDVYSMGVVLYQLLAGQVPFNANSIFEIHNQHLQAIPESPTIYYPHIPPEIVSAVMKALEKEPEKRFKTAEEFLQTLPDLKPRVQPVIIPPLTIVDEAVIDVRPLAISVQPPPIPFVSPAISVQPSLISVPPPIISISPPPSGANPQSLPAASRSRAVDQSTIQVPDKAPPVAAIKQHISSSRAVAPGANGSRNWPLIGGLTVGLIVLVGGGSWYALHSGSTRPEPAPIAVTTQPTRPTNSGPTVSSEPPPPEPQPAKKGGSPAPNPGIGTNKTPDKKAVPESPKTTPPAPPVPVPGQELSGLWQGKYIDSKSNEQTSVRIQLLEHGGSDISGTLAFTKADKTSGTCDLKSSSYDASTGHLKLISHCPDIKVTPGYLNTPTNISVASLTATSLSGTISYYPGVTVTIKR